MKKIWSVILGASGVLWIIDGTRVIYGYTPDKFSTVVAFIATGIMVIGWAIEEWNEE